MMNQLIIAFRLRLNDRNLAEKSIMNYGENTGHFLSHLYNLLTHTFPGNYQSEWVTNFNGISWTADSEVHVVHTSSEIFLMGVCGSGFRYDSLG